MFTKVAKTIYPIDDPHLQQYGDDDEGEHEVVERVLLRTHLQDVLELRRVRRQQGHVQHALRDRLFRRIAVRVKSLTLKEENKNAIC
jgi:hypothetical protein